jgi:hypothetical protein
MAQCGALVPDTFRELLRHRLHVQRVTSAPLATAADVVRQLGAVQAQEYGAARWALALRARVTGADVDRALASAAIIRTHVMRPTWHFVAPEDIRWLLKLTGPRVNASNAYYYRKWELSAQMFVRSARIFEKALEGGTHLTRPELAAALVRGRVLRGSDESLRINGLLMRAELDGLICSGPRRGNQFTYALLDERVPPGADLTREEARAELARRFFTGHGPGTPNDLAWWSGLTLTDARAGIADVRHLLDADTVNGSVYWRGTAQGQPRRRRAQPAASLIPVYDESVLPFRDSRAALRAHAEDVMRDNGQIVVIDGRAVATWRRTLTRTTVVLRVTPLARTVSDARRAIAHAAARYGRFACRTPVVEYTRQGP